MNKHAVYHVLDTPYSYGKDMNTLIVRIRVARNDIKTCTIYYKDRYDWQDAYNSKEMVVVAETELFTYYQTEISLDKGRYRYYFLLLDKEDKEFLYLERGFTKVNYPYKDMNGFQFPYIAEEDLYKEEKWLQESVVYQIFPDRFNNGDPSINPKDVLPWGKGKTASGSMYGGDLKGIIDKLDYLAELGVDLLYLTPIFKSKSNHKYNTTDYFDIDPQFGTLDIAKELVEKAHNRGMKVVFDAVFNHSGGDFFAFEDLLKNQKNSQYKDWYFIDSWPVSKEKCNYYTFADDISEMPKLNTNNLKVRDYLLKVGEYWVKEIGIDGWRLDVCDEVGHDFWRDFKKVVKNANENAIIIGEIMHEANSFLKGDQLDGIMNYPFKNATIDFFCKKDISGREFFDIMAANRMLYMDSITKQMWNLVGSHDTKRVLTECDGKISRMKMAVAFQFSYIGVPYIYYGDEIGLCGEEDPDNRRCMIWDEGEQNKELFQLYKKLIKIRKENKALIYGSFVEVYCSDGVIVFEREYDSEKIICIFNNSENEYAFKKEGQTILVDLCTDKSYKYTNNIIIESLSFKIFKI